MTVSNKTPEGEFITAEEVAQIFCLPITKIKRLARSGNLPFYKFGHRTIRFRKIDCDKMAQSFLVGKGKA